MGMLEVAVGAVVRLVSRLSPLGVCARGLVPPGINGVLAIDSGAVNFSRLSFRILSIHILVVLH